MSDECELQRQDFFHPALIKVFLPEVADGDEVVIAERGDELLLIGIDRIRIDDRNR